jgi:hypothetical protein
MRFLIRFLFLSAAILLVSPFLISSLLVDHQGVLVPGQVTSKSEYIWVQYSSWTRKLEVAVQFQPPDDIGVRYMTAEFLPDQYDRLRKGDVVQLHYLLRKDLPAWPGFRTLREMRILPYARPADQDTWTAPAAMISPHRSFVAAVLIVAIVLLLWRLLRIPYFKIAVGTCIGFALIISIVAEFPTATPAPRIGIRTATGTIKTLERWQFLFQSAHSRTTWTANQPIAVAGVEFVPQEKADPVVAVDLVDDGSLPGLTEHSAVTIDYEISSPRTAHIRGATRRFAQRNFKGLIVQLLSMLLVVIVIFAGFQLFRFFIRLLMQRSSH